MAETRYCVRETANGRVIDLVFVPDGFLGWIADPRDVRYESPALPMMVWDDRAATQGVSPA